MTEQTSSPSRKRISYQMNLEELLIEAACELNLVVSKFVAESETVAW